MMSVMKKQEDPLQETEESIVVDGETFKKPFVEKPLSAENHNIYIYYPPSSGGGSKRLFRKVKDRSSKFVSSVSTVRRSGAYIYEEFIGTDGMDIKVYTVGPDYAHAEARKAPTVDGRVQRRDDGREVRYHVILNKTEKEIARRITEIFGQNVCGFDLLRTETMSYVCDVNGLSFVKGAQKYYNDFALILYEMIQTHLHPPAIEYISQATTLVRDNDMNMDALADDEYKTGRKELRCLFAVIRHGDRTPKEKVKVKVSHPKMLAMFDGREPKQIRLRTDAEIKAFVDVVREMVVELRTQTVRPPLTFGTASLPSSPTAASAATTKGGPQVLHPVPLPHSGMTNATTSAPAGAAGAGAAGRPQTAATCESDGKAELLKKLEMIELAFEDQDQITALSRKVQLRPTKFSTAEDGKIAVKQVLVIVKYGGQLTDFGFKQADLLGKYYHQYLYPPDTSSNLSLHSSFAHDIKYYASDEGRVQMSAAVFAKSFLDLDDDEIIPIMYALVWNDARSNALLEFSAPESLKPEKLHIAEILNADVDFSDAALDQTQIFGSLTVEQLLETGIDAVGNPLQRLHELRAAIERLCCVLEDHCRSRSQAGVTPPPLANSSGSNGSGHDFPGSPLPVAVTQQVSRASTLAMRSVGTWRAFRRTFYDAHTDRFDVFRVPEIADCARFNAIHFDDIVPEFRAVWDAARPLYYWIVPNTYGLTTGSKISISEQIIRPLVDKLKSDLTAIRTKTRLQTVSRFYFSSESHMNPLYNFFEHRMQRTIAGQRFQDYISQFVVKLYENTWLPVSHPRRFTVDLWHSSGANAVNLEHPPGTMETFMLPLEPVRLHVPLDIFLQLIT